MVFFVSLGIQSRTKMKKSIFILLYIGICLSEPSRSEMSPSALLIGHWYRNTDEGRDYYYNNNEYSYKKFPKDGSELIQVDRYKILKEDGNTLHLQLFSLFSSMGIGDEFLTVTFSEDGMTATSLWQMKSDIYETETEKIEGIIEKTSETKWRMMSTLCTN